MSQKQPISKYANSNLNSQLSKGNQNGSEQPSTGTRYGSMLVLSQKKKPSVTSLGSKLTVPKPVNLPSIKKEHGGNDPATQIVHRNEQGTWQKPEEQQPQVHTDNLRAQSDHFAQRQQLQRMQGQPWSSRVDGRDLRALNPEEFPSLETTLNRSKQQIRPRPYPYQIQEYKEWTDDERAPQDGNIPYRRPIDDVGGQDSRDDLHDVAYEQWDNQGYKDDSYNKYKPRQRFSEHFMPPPMADDHGKGDYDRHPPNQYAFQYVPPPPPPPRSLKPKPADGEGVTDESPSYLHGQYQSKVEISNGDMQQPYSVNDINNKGGDDSVEIENDDKAEFYSQVSQIVAQMGKGQDLTNASNGPSAVQLSMAGPQAGESNQNPTPDTQAHSVPNSQPVYNANVYTTAASTNQPGSSDDAEQQAVPQVSEIPQGQAQQYVFKAPPPPPPRTQQYGYSGQYEDSAANAPYAQGPAIYGSEAQQQAGLQNVDYSTYQTWDVSAAVQQPAIQIATEVNRSAVSGTQQGNNDGDFEIEGEGQKQMMSLGGAAVMTKTEVKPQMFGEGEGVNDEQSKGTNSVGDSATVRENISYAQKVAGLLSGVGGDGNGEGGDGSPLGTHGDLAEGAGVKKEEGGRNSDNYRGKRGGGKRFDNKDTSLDEEEGNGYSGRGRGRGRRGGRAGRGGSAGTVDRRGVDRVSNGKSSAGLTQKDVIKANAIAREALKGIRGVEQGENIGTGAADEQVTSNPQLADNQQGTLMNEGSNSNNVQLQERLQMTSAGGNVVDSIVGGLDYLQQQQPQQQNLQQAQYAMFPEQQATSLNLHSTPHNTPPPPPRNKTPLGLESHPHHARSSLVNPLSTVDQASSLSYPQELLPQGLINDIGVTDQGCSGRAGSGGTAGTGKDGHSNKENEYIQQNSNGFSSVHDGQGNKLTEHSPGLDGSAVTGNHMDVKGQLISHSPNPGAPGVEPTHNALAVDGNTHWNAAPLPSFGVPQADPSAAYQPQQSGVGGAQAATAASYQSHPGSVPQLGAVPGAHTATSAFPPTQAATSSSFLAAGQHPPPGLTNQGLSLNPYPQSGTTQLSALFNIPGLESGQSILGGGAQGTQQPMQYMLSNPLTTYHNNAISFPQSQAWNLNTIAQFWPHAEANKDSQAADGASLGTGGLSGGVKPVMGVPQPMGGYDQLLAAQQMSGTSVPYATLGGTGIAAVGQPIAGGMGKVGEEGKLGMQMAVGGFNAQGVEVGEVYREEGAQNMESGVGETQTSVQQVGTAPTVPVQIQETATGYDKTNQNAQANAAPVATSTKHPAAGTSVTGQSTGPNPRQHSARGPKPRSHYNQRQQHGGSGDHHYRAHRGGHHASSNPRQQSQEHGRDAASTRSYPSGNGPTGASDRQPPPLQATPPPSRAHPNQRAGGPRGGAGGVRNRFVPKLGMGGHVPEGQPPPPLPKRIVGGGPMRGRGARGPYNKSKEIVADKAAVAQST